MANDRRLIFHPRLEDLVALAFFVLNLGFRLVFRGAAHANLSPANVLIIVPAMSLLLAKELIHYFVAGKTGVVCFFCRPARLHTALLGDRQRLVPVSGDIVDVLLALG